MKPTLIEDQSKQKTVTLIKKKISITFHLSSVPTLMFIISTFLPVKDFIYLVNMPLKVSHEARIPHEHWESVPEHTCNDLSAKQSFFPA